MHKILPTVILFATFIFFGCSKSEKGVPDNKYYFTVKVDGVEKTATDQSDLSGLKAQVVYLNSGGYNALLISGRWWLATTSKKMGGTDLMIQPFPKKTGTYSVGAGTSDHSITHWMDMSPPAGREDDDIYSAAGTYGSGNIALEFFDGKEVRGTFQGTLVNTNRKTINLTEGKFYMPVDMSQAK
ncbi:MAG: hypothetical protein J7599_06485 [Niabella sp.]|nr:hypothetical protein [Niabella sp.]